MTYSHDLSSVFLAIPNTGWLHARLAERCIGWVKAGAVLYAPSDLRPIPYARNVCVSEFLKSGREYLWFVDADTVPPLEAPFELLGADVDAISGVVHQIKKDVDGVEKRVGMVARRNGTGELKAAVGQEVEQIDACGSGCILFRRDVFERLEFPWYEERPWGDVRGSDFILCERMASAGIELHAHFGVLCAHRKEVEL